MRRTKIIKSDRTVGSELGAIYNEHLQHFLASKQDMSRIKSLRPSQLPFCPASFFIHHATFGDVRVMDMGGAFYTSIGTAVHEVVQTYMCRSGNFLANWQCRQCGKKHKVTMQTECCDFTMDYHEIEINYKGIVGHIDAVFRDRNGYYWIVDFKTTSIASAPKKIKQPPVGYLEQVEAYALMLWLQHGIKVKGVVLMYIKRNNPDDPLVWSKTLSDDDFAVIKRRMIKYKRMHKQVLAAKTKGDVLALLDHGRCGSEWCKVCKSSVPLKSQLLKAYTKGEHRLPLKDL